MNIPEQPSLPLSLLACALVTLLWVLKHLVIWGAVFGLMAALMYGAMRP